MHNLQNSGDKSKGKVLDFNTALRQSDPVPDSTPADVESYFIEKLRENGIRPGDHLTEGELTRATCDCKPSKTGRDGNAWYVFHADDPATLAYGCNKSDCQNAAPKTITAKADKELTPADREALKARIEANRQARERERQRQEAVTRAEAARLWAEAGAVSPEHPYITKKGIRPEGIRQHGEMLLIPMTENGIGEPASIQRIYATGEKRFLKGTGAIPGPLYNVIPGDNGPLYIVEGYATGCSVHEATGATVVVAFSADRLVRIAEAVRSHFPARGIVVAGDAGNGSEKATEAAQRVGGTAVLPAIPAGSGGTDWNDLHKAAGLEEVARQLGECHTTNAARWGNLIDMRRLASIEPTPPAFIIPNWLPCGYATLFAGHGGIGKSGIALTMAICIAMGLKFFGMPVQQRKVLYLSCEDREGVLHWRLSRICRYLGISISALDGWLDILDLVGHETILYRPNTNGTHTTAAYSHLAARVENTGREVLFIDGISDTYDGNENSRAEVKSYVNAALALIPPESGAVVLIGHVAKVTANTKTAEGYSGSTGWHNAVRARWYLYPEASFTAEDGNTKNGNLALELQKSNLGASDKAMKFSWDKDAEIFAGLEVFSETMSERDSREQKERDGIIAALVACTDYVPAATTGPRTAYQVLSAQLGFPETLRDSQGKRRFWRIVEQLRAMQYIEESSIARKSDRKLVRILKPGKALQQCSNAEIQH